MIRWILLVVTVLTMVGLLAFDGPVAKREKPGRGNASVSIIGGAIADPLLGANPFPAGSGPNVFTSIFYGEAKTGDPNEFAVQSPIPVAGTVSDLHVFVEIAPGDPDARFFIALRKNAGEQALSCTIQGSDTACSDTDTNHSVGFLAGDRISLRVARVFETQQTGMRWTAKFALAAP